MNHITRQQSLNQQIIISENNEFNKGINLNYFEIFNKNRRTIMIT